MIYRTCRSNQSKYCSNRIQTSKYTWFNFIPKNLFEQITKIPNFYFLVLSIIQTIPVLSNSGGQPTILIQLSIIMFVSMIKDFYEDYKRKISDKEENSRKTEINGQKVQWQDIFVGQIVKIYNNEYFPADVLILGSSQKKGNCFIETKNLDGESNLKLKLTASEILNYYQESDFYNKHICLEYDLPNTLLYSFKGTGYLDGSAYDQMQIKEQLLLKLQKQKLNNSDELIQLQKFLENFNKFSVDANHIILRGCQLRNTEYIYGLVIYTGHDTKIMLNSIRPKYKKSLLENGLGYQILFLFLFEIIMCLFCSFYYATWFRDNKNELYYLEIPKDNTFEDNYGYNVIIKIGTWILIFAKFVPISLFVSLEITKLIQGIVIYLDERCSKDGIKCAVQSSNLIEELGVISYIFSDKTGTLTKNIMVFKQICINGISYGDKNTIDKPIIDFVDFYDEVFIENMQNKEQQNIHLNLIILSLCHSAIIEFVDGKPEYTFTSPDELALLNFAKSKGYQYKSIDDSNIITLQCGDNDQKYQMLYNLEFDSSRKRNSVIVRNLSNNQIMMLSKGADSFMMNNSCAKLDEDDLYKGCLYDYSIKGLRCLVLGYKIISEKDYNDWNQLYRQAQYQLEDRELKLRELQDQFEKDFHIIGITAVQDKLQDNVEITIKAFRDAGIKVWVITGDKMETAINIGYSCQLLSSKMNLVQIDQTDPIRILELLELTTDALAINGDSFQIIVNDQQLTQKLINVSSKCQSVLCCRASPKQKQEIVKLVISHIPNKSCLAIGDGANDVSMISTAHVGVGIIGVEGSQAARAADFAIGEFQILRNLLFVYGREAYRKNSQLIFYTFYKNILLVFPQFWYGMNSFFSGQSLFDAIIYQLYNVIYTSSPIVVYAVFDNQFTYNQLFQNEGGKLYEIGLKNTKFNYLQYSRWLIQATFESIIITFFFSQSLDYTMSYYGKNYCFYWTGMAIYGVIVVVANLKIIVMSHDINLIGFISYFVMIAAYLVSLTIFMKIKSYDWLYYIYDKLFVVKEFYLANLLVIGSTSLLDYGLIKIFDDDSAYLIDITPPQVNQIQQDSEQMPLSK